MQQLAVDSPIDAYETTERQWPYWVVGVFETQKQGVALKFLKDQRIPFWAPRYKTVRTRRHRRVDCVVYMLPSYILMPAPFFDSVHLRRLAPGFHSYLFVNNGLALIRDESLDPLRALEKDLNDPRKIETAAGPAYKIGDRVRMIKDLWEKVEREIVAIDASKKLTLDGPIRITGVDPSEVIPADVG